jgi:hypothetical protein
MAFTYGDLQAEVKRRALRNQSGTEYDEEIKNIINTSLFRTAREAAWRCLRRKTYFTTKSSYNSGTNYMTVINSSTAFSMSNTGCSFWQDKIEIGRYIKFGTDSWNYTIRALNSGTNGVIDLAYRGTTSTATTYEILPQAEYNLPIQVDHRAFLWHEDYGYPYRMDYIPEQSFLDGGIDLVEKNTPTHYRMWGEDTVMAQVPTATPLMIVSSSATDSTVNIMMFGKISGYPYYESVKLAGTTTTKTAYEFESVERISKDGDTYGRITVTSSRGSYTVAVLPAGDTTATIKYSKVQLYPLPNRNFDINVYYYKDPYRLVNDDDIHELGQEFDEAIILLSVAKIKYQDSQTEADRWFGLYNDEIRNLKKTNMDKIDWLPTLQRPGRARGNNYVHPQLKRNQAGSYF